MGWICEAPRPSVLIAEEVETGMTIGNNSGPSQHGTPTWPMSPAQMPMSEEFRVEVATGSATAGFGD